jgi:hypothetical protein
MPEFERYKPPQRGKTIVLSICVCLLVAAPLSYWKLKRPLPAPVPDFAREIGEARGAAKYDQALQLLAAAQKEHQGEAQIQSLAAELQEELKPDIRLHYLTHVKNRLTASIIRSRLQLVPDDEFYFTVNLSSIRRPSYVYLFLVDSNGDWHVLLPNKMYAPNSNPLSPASYQVPDNIRRKLRPPEMPGVEKLFVVAAYWRVEALEAMASAISAESNPERLRALGQELLARLRLEEAKPSGLHGLAVGTEEFDDAGRAGGFEGERP